MITRWSLLCYTRTGILCLAEHFCRIEICFPTGRNYHFAQVYSAFTEKSTSFPGSWNYRHRLRILQTYHRYNSNSNNRYCNTTKSCAISNFCSSDLHEELLRVNVCMFGCLFVLVWKFYIWLRNYVHICMYVRHIRKRRKWQGKAALWHSGSLPNMSIDDHLYTLCVCARVCVVHIYAYIIYCTYVCMPRRLTSHLKKKKCCRRQPHLRSASPSSLPQNPK